MTEQKACCYKFKGDVAWKNAGRVTNENCSGGEKNSTLVIKVNKKIRNKTQWGQKRISNQLGKPNGRNNECI